MTKATSTARRPSEENPGSGLYVDLENLHSDGLRFIQSLISCWPDKAPAPTWLRLYVRANQTAMWRLWAESRFSGIKVVVSGTQHFSKTSTKNSADIAIAANAMSDLALGRVSHIVVFSDDSDFISLYEAIRDEPAITPIDARVPFLWVVTDREGHLSPTVRQFFPPDALHVVALESSRPQADLDAEPPGGIWAEMADAVLSDMPVGTFKSTECQPVIRARWPGHALCDAGGSAFGIEFKNNIWPILEKSGVKIKNPGKKPIQYEMTPEAKSASR